jgi:transposase
MIKRGCVALRDPRPRNLLEDSPVSKEVIPAMIQTLVAGIDVAAKTFTTQLMKEDGIGIGKIQEFPNTPAGAAGLEKILIETLTQKDCQKLKVGLEATAFFDWHLADYLAGSSLLADWKPQVYRLNALRVSRFRKSSGEVDKTDSVDASIIADFVRLGRNLPSPHLACDPYLPLKRLARYRFHLAGTLEREMGHFLTHLFLQSSGLSQQNPLTNPLHATGSALIEEFLSTEEIAGQSVEDLVEFLIRHGKNRFPDPEGMAQKVQQAARESYRLRPELARSEHFILASLLRNIRALKAGLKEVNAAIAQEMKAFPNTLTTLPGVGPVFSAGILSEIGSIQKFDSDDAIAKMAGLVWPRHQSGNFEGQDRHLLRSANKYLRYYLCEAANALRIHDASYRAFYEMKSKEVPKHKHKRAIVLTARKLVRLIFAMLKRGQIYQPQSAVQPAGQEHAVSHLS